MSEKIPIDLDASEAYKTLADLETARKNTASAINTTLSMARSAWTGISAIVQISGGTVSSLFTTVISAGISMVSILTPILAGQAATGDYVRAAIGMINIGMAIAAIIAAQNQETEMAQKLHSANAFMHSVQMMIGNIPSLW